jgi:hypothetical protein
MQAPIICHRLTRVATSIRTIDPELVRNRLKLSEEDRGRGNEKRKPLKSIPLKMYIV